MSNITEKQQLLNQIANFDLHQLQLITNPNLLAIIEVLADSGPQTSYQQLSTILNKVLATSTDLNKHEVQSMWLLYQIITNLVEDSQNQKSHNTVTSVFTIDDGELLPKSIDEIMEQAKNQTIKPKL